VKKNVASQKVAVYAWDTVNRVAKTGDAANITGQISKDGGAAAATNDTNPTELDATNFPGVYIFDMTQAETNADLVILQAKSSSTGISILPVLIYPIIQVTGDAYAIVAHADYGNAKLVRSTTPANALDVSATGEAGLDFANIKAASAPTTLTNITVPTVTTVGTLTTYTGNTPQTGDAFARLGAPAGASVSADIAAIEAQTDDIGAAGAGLTAVPWNAAWNAEVNAEVVDALNVDTYAEPGQGAPAATASLAAKVNYLYKAWRNKKIQDATTFELYNDAGDTVDQKATVSDDGTDFSFGEITSGA